MEPWLAVSLLSFVPGIGLFFSPSEAFIALYVAMGALMATGTAMLLYGELRSARSK